MFLAVLKKEYLTELRSKEAFSLVLSFQLLLALVLGLSIESAYLDRSAIEKLFPALFYLIVVITAALGLSRTAESEFETGAILGIAASSSSLAGYFLAKALFGAVLLLISSSIGGFFLAILLNTESSLFDTFYTLPVLCLGLSSILTLLSPLSFTSRLKGLILPIIALPCAIPLFILSIEETYRRINLTSTGDSLLLPLALFALVYTALGTRLFRSAVLG
jgi:ABC-type transport system involved in cytochrome c biogenesis permease component